MPAKDIIPADLERRLERGYNARTHPALGKLGLAGRVAGRGTCRCRGARDGDRSTHDAVQCQHLNRQPVRYPGEARHHWATLMDEGGYWRSNKPTRPTLIPRHLQARGAGSSRCSSLSQVASPAAAQDTRIMAAATEADYQRDPTLAALRKSATPSIRGLLFFLPIYISETLLCFLERTPDWRSPLKAS